MWRFAAAALALLATPAVAHDWYEGEVNAAGDSCCGGDPITGDCDEIDPAVVHCGLDGCDLRFTRADQHVTFGRMPARFPLTLHFDGQPGISPYGVSACFTKTDVQRGVARCLWMTAGS